MSLSIASIAIKPLKRRIVHFNRHTAQEEGKIMTLDYSTQGCKPSATQIVSDWKKGGSPDRFEVVYGETFTEFRLFRSHSHFFGETTKNYWDAYGNGCSGIKRDAVTAALNYETRKGIS